MCRAWVQEIACRYALCISRGIGWAAVAVEPISDTSPLCVVEDIESLRSEFQLHRLGKREVLEHRHVKIRAPRVSQAVATGVAKRQPARRRVGPRIEEERARDVINKLDGWR